MYLAAIQYLFENLNLDELKINTFKKDSKVQYKRNLTYLISYPVFISHFAKKSILTHEDLIICGNLAYAWMPTVLVWKTHDFNLVVEILNKVYNSSAFDLSIDQLTTIKNLVNGSIVGMSKVLHFVNPECYPIWDSRISETINSEESKELSIQGYIDYAKQLNKIKNTTIVTHIRSSLEEILGYKITNLRSIEMVLFYSKINFSQVKVKTTKVLNVPKYKRDGFVFISNLGKITANEDYDLSFKRDQN